MDKNDKFIMINLDDERSKNIAEVLGNKTCKKIIDYLSDIKEASEKDIADSLSMPINTIEYNLKKLIESGLIDKTKNFFWSVKGRKIDMYRLSNKRIIISPKNLAKGIVPVFLGVLLLSFGIKVFSDRLGYNGVNQVLNASRDAAAIAPSMAEKIGASGGYIPVQQVQNICYSTGIEAWAWFLFGSLFAILIFLLWNQLKFKRMKGGF